MDVIDKKSVNQNINLYSKIKTSLTYLGFDFSNLGATYLQDIIYEVLKQPSLIHSLVTKVYDIIANNYNVSKSSVERATRFAIIKAYKLGMVGEIAYFRDNKAPTVKQMVNFMYDYFMEFDYLI